jgi:hypothetical protein
VSHRFWPPVGTRPPRIIRSWRRARSVPGRDDSLNLQRAFNFLADLRADQAPRPSGRQPLSGVGAQPLDGRWRGAINRSGRREGSAQAHEDRGLPCGSPIHRAACPREVEALRSRRARAIGPGGLLGDPQQLPQVARAAHPDATSLSVLERISPARSRPTVTPPHSARATGVTRLRGFRCSRVDSIEARLGLRFWLRCRPRAQKSWTLRHEQPRNGVLGALTNARSPAAPSRSLS